MLKDIYSAPRTPVTQIELNAVMASHDKYLAVRGGTRAQFNLRSLDGLNLANRNLSEADFSGASLVNATLYGSNLIRTNFYCADLRGSNLKSTNLSHADLRGASFRGASLSNAMLDNADLRAAVMMVAKSGTDRNAGKDGDHAIGVDFSNCSMKNVSLGNAKLNGANFSGAILHGANFKGAQLPNVNLEGAILTGVSMNDLVVPPSALKGCITDVSPEIIARSDALKATIETHQQWIAADGAQGSAAVLDGEDLRPLQQFFTGRPLTALSARNVIAIGVSFSGCQLQAARFDGADLRDADFTGADLRGVSFAGAKLSHARFDRANMAALHLANGNKLAPNLTAALATEEQFILATVDGALASLGLSTDRAEPA